MTFSFQQAVGRVTRAAVVALPLAVAPALGSPFGAQAETRTTDKLLDLLGVPETIEIMRVEGLAYADELAADMLPSSPGVTWQKTIETIYDPDRMEETVRAGFADSFLSRDVNPDTLETFFGSDLGQDIIRLEISAREAMVDQAIEDAARAAYLDRAGATEAEDARLAQIKAFVEANDLVEANVVGGMNTTIAFYQGLVDGGALDMSEPKIIAEVWGSEGETRTDTMEWIFGFLMMAYRPLSDDDLMAYADVVSTPEGKAMNTALFAGFDAMYGDISYALGRAIAGQMDVQDL
ncbi:DUF2059 domain-containing protein [Primorskyibacter sp. S187A]|uniref:DUF2059 domain-containing protein n=1 Tax=Primorskyibacter sp. S187A TaxID=3415130 RepID=UPI003C7C5AE7